MNIKQEIHFDNEDILPSQINLTTIISWLKKSLQALGATNYNIQYALLDDDEIRHANKTYLQHDYSTDIITFNNSDDDQFLEADILIGVETIIDNTEQYETTVQMEFARVCIHGILHLCGFDDKTQNQQQTMTEQENKYLKKLTVPRGTI